MSRWDAVSDYDYAEAIGAPVTRMRHSEPVRSLQQICAKGGHQVWKRHPESVTCPLCGATEKSQ